MFLSILAQTVSAVSFTVTPSSVSNNYSGFVTLQVTGITPGDTVLVQKYLDLNSNGVIDNTDWLVQQFTLTDGQAGMIIGGIVNSNVPGDTDTTGGTITTPMAFLNDDFSQNVAGQYLYALSSPAGHFPAITNTFNVVAAPYPQQVSGMVTNNAGPVLPYAVIVVLADGKEAIGGTVANGAGAFNVPLPTGSYNVIALKSNYPRPPTATSTSPTARITPIIFR